MKNKIASKEFRLANDEEIESIAKKLVSSLKNDNKKHNEEFDQNEEIDSYIDYKKTMSVTRTDILLTTNKTITLFDCLHISETFDGKVFKTNYHFLLSSGKLKEISLDDILVSE